MSRALSLSPYIYIYVCVYQNKGGLAPMKNKALKTFTYDCTILSLGGWRLRLSMRSLSHNSRYLRGGLFFKAESLLSANAVQYFFPP